jgi:nicotinamide-nucleotide amidase
MDSNSQWLSQCLEEIGVPTRFHTTVGDDLDDCADVFRTALRRANLVIATGGLGPTADDLTRQAISQATNRELVLNPSALEHIRSIFRARDRIMPDRNQVQAMFPSGSLVIPNPHGTAPGIDLSVSGPHAEARLFALPGVPAEMIEMWHDSVKQRIRSIPGVGGNTILHRRVKCFGVGESECERMLPDLIRRGRIPKVGITVHRGTITLRITAEANTVDDCQLMLQPTLDTIQDCLGEIAFGCEDDELQDAVIQILSARGETVSVCEWGTCGVISQWLATSDRLATVFRGGFIARSIETLASMGYCDSPHLAPTGQELASQMAQSVREKFGTTYGLSITAFPDNLGEGSYSLGITAPHSEHSKSRIYAAHPDVALELAAKTVINQLRLLLLSREDGASTNPANSVL